MKKITLLLTMLLGVVGGVSAKTVTTTLWDGTYTDGVELSTTGLAAGDILCVYVTVPAGGANFKIVYKGESNGWAETTIPSINTQWPWVNGGETYKDFTLTSEDITALSGMNIYIYKGDNSTIDKVTKTTEASPSGTTEVWNGTHNFGSWSGLKLTETTYKNILVNAKKGDVLKATYTSGEAGAIQFCNSSWEILTDGSFSVTAADVATTIEYEITDATILENIQLNGLVMNGEKAILSKIELLTYSDSYDAVPLTIGSDGITTYGSSKNLDFSGLTGVTPYYVSSVETGSVTLTSVTATRAWAGYIVQGPAGTYEVPVANEEPDWKDAFSNLRYSGDYNGNWVYRSAYSGYSGGGDNETKIKTYYRYIFAKDNSDQIGFYKLATDYSRTVDANTVYYHELAAHKAYLETPSDITPTGSAPVMLMFNDSETTGIEGCSLKSAVRNNVYYNMNGQRVAHPTKGLYIVNGKKVIIK